MSEQLFVGIDLGGSGTRAALADATGNVLALGLGPTGLLGISGAASNRQLARALDAALAPIARQTANTTATTVYAGTRGLSVPGRRERLELELTTRFPKPVRVHVSSDAHTGVWGGLAGQPGVAVIAGAGSIAFARTADGRQARAGGWGYVLGDEGSGYWLGREAVRCYLRTLERRVQPGELSNLIKAALTRNSTVGDVLGWFYGGHDQVDRLAALAPRVSHAAKAGDYAALDILHRAGCALAEIAAAAAEQVFSDAAIASGVDVVSVGGVWAAGDALDRPFLKRLSERLPGVKRATPKLSPLGGALLLAMGADQRPVSPAIVERLADHL